MNRDTGLLDQHWFIGPATNSDTGLLDQQRTGILVYWTSNEQGYWFIGPGILVYWTSNKHRDTGLLDQQ